MHKFVLNEKSVKLLELADRKDKHDGTTNCLRQNIFI